MQQESKMLYHTKYKCGTCGNAWSEWIEYGQAMKLLNQYSRYYKKKFTLSDLEKVEVLTLVCGNCFGG